MNSDNHERSHSSNRAKEAFYYYYSKGKSEIKD